MSAAVLWEVNQEWSVEEVELDGPQEGEVLVSFEATGLCEDVPSSVELWRRSGEHRAALTSSVCTTGPTGSGFHAAALREALSGAGDR
jgi:threonine dehydrogenase-like Zn-dependent dehydrogenase